MWGFFWISGIKSFFTVPLKANLSSILSSALKAPKRVAHVITSANISDHWKEKVIPAYALRMMKVSLQILLIILAILSVALNILIPIILPKWTSAINIAILFSFCLPIKQISSYLNFAIKSKEINKLKFEPIMHMISTFILLLGTAILYYTKNLNIYNFIIIDLLAIFFVQIITVFYYLQLINQKIKGFNKSK